MGLIGCSWIAISESICLSAKVSNFEQTRAAPNVQILPASVSYTQRFWVRHEIAPVQIVG
jgi:hypothetical protein